MKRVIALLLLGLILLLASCASWQSAVAADAGEVITRHDDMTGIKTSEVLIIKDKFNFILGSTTEQFVLRVAESKASTNYYICFRLYDSSWWFVDTLLVKVGDNEPIYLKSISENRDTSTLLDSVKISEWVVFKASLEMFQIAAAAENIRVRIIGSKHREDYEITAEDQIRIKRLLGAI